MSHNNCCNRCGGGIDQDHPTTCSPCRWEQRNPGRSWEAAVNSQHLSQRTNINGVRFVVQR